MESYQQITVDDDISYWSITFGSFLTNSCLSILRRSVLIDESPYYDNTEEKYK